MFNIRVILAFILGSTFGIVAFVSYCLWDDNKTTARKNKAIDDAIARLNNDSSKK